MTNKQLDEMIQDIAGKIIEKDKSAQADILKEAANEAALAAVLNPEFTEKVLEGIKAKASKEFKPDVGSEDEKEFKSFGECLTLFKAATFGATGARNDSRVKKYRYKTAGHMEETADYQGGFLVPDEYKAELLSVGLESVVVRNNGPTIITMVRDRVQIPYINDTSHSSTVWGGVNPDWVEEAGTKTPTKPDIGLVELQPYKLCGIIYASDELLADSAIALDPLIRRLFGAAINWEEDGTFIDGNGAGRPLGILNAPCLVTQAKESPQATATITWDNIVKMYSRMLPTSHGRAVWVANPQVFPELARMAQSVGTGGTGVWMGPGSGVNSPPVTILGRPVIFTEHCKALGTVGDFYYADFSYYLIGDRKDITIDVSAHVKFVNDELCWRFVKRVDGQPWMSAPLTPRYGGSGATRSAFVALETR